MSTDPVKFGLADIADVVTTQTDGQLPLIVGGQAVNIWAIVYSPRVGHALQVFEPFVSKDIDLYGPQKILHDLSRKYGAPLTLSPPRLPGIGQMIIPKGELMIKVELLNGVKGLRRIGEENAMEIAVNGITVRVLDPFSCLKAKISNAADLDQTRRQDVKHVQIMKLCATEYAKDLLSLGAQKIFTEREVIDLLSGLRKTVSSAEAKTVTRKWQVTFERVLPIQEMEQSPLRKVQNFLRIDLRREFLQQPKSQGKGCRDNRGRQLIGLFVLFLLFRGRGEPTWVSLLPRIFLPASYLDRLSHPSRHNDPVARLQEHIFGKVYYNHVNVEERDLPPAINAHFHMIPICRETSGCSDRLRNRKSGHEWKFCRSFHAALD
ncbi:hypothetical protein BH09VER1_BH09VER1_49860 [soil metagenome]